MSLSLCMIVKNEAATLPKCLNSVRKVVDEMVVLDTGSIDRTP
ncbi:MAG: glycosyltransferase, partial [Nostoc sp.]